VADIAAKGTRLSGAARESLASELSEKYANGASIRDLAAETGRSYGFIHRLLVESEVPLRGRGGSAKARRSKAGG
jgi:hypothetical protein